MSVLKFFRNAFAVSGDRTTVGDTTDDSVNYYDGYTSNYELDPESDPDGLYIDRGSMNQLFYDLTSNVQHYQQHMFPEWIEDSDGVGTPYSYDAGAIVAYYDTTGGTWGYYLSTADSNTGTPGTDSDWVEFSFGTASNLDAITANTDAWGGAATVSETGETVVGSTVSFTASSESGASVSLSYDNTDAGLYWNGDKLLTDADYSMSSSAAWGFIPFVAATGETYVGDSIEFTASSEAGASFSLAYSSTDDGLYWNGVRLATTADIDAIEDYTLVAGSVPIWYDGYQNTDARYYTDTVGFISTQTAICRSAGTITVRADFGESVDGAYCKVLKNSTEMDTFTNVDNTAFTTSFSVAVGDAVYLRLYVAVEGEGIELDKWQIQSDTTDHIGQVI